MANLKENKEKVNQFFAEIEQYPMLCQSCGMCQGVCPSGAIKIGQNDYKQFVPSIDTEKCIGCTQCIKACPVRENAYKEQSVIGPYYKIFLAKSSNVKHQENGSSGGVVTALLQYGLATQKFSEVLTVSNKESAVVAKPKYVIDIEKESGSKYVSEPLCTVFDRKKTKVAVTALPCEAKAIKKQNTDAFLFGLFCSKLSLEDLVNYVVTKNNQDVNDIKEVTYRRGNWPGKFTVTFRNNDKKICEDLNRSKFNSAYNSYNFSSSGCLLCDDYFAESADISFGDPWGRKQYVEGYKGETVVIVRTKRALEFVNDAISNNIIETSEIKLEDVIKGHQKEIYNKKTALLQRIKIFKKSSAVMDNYDTDVLIQAKNFNLLNKYVVHNNWNRRKSKRKYSKILKSSNSIMFFTRFTHAFLLSKRLKKSKNFDKYLEIAKGEKIESE